MKKILIIGATSAIAEAVARIFAERGDKMYLLARNFERLSLIAEDLKVRGAVEVNYSQIDVNDFKSHLKLIEQAFSILGRVDVVLISHGSLPCQEACEGSCSATLAEINTNAVSTILLLTHIANKLEKQKNGTVAVLTSVAGERGRQSNYIYGAAKGMVSIFLQGLRNRMYSIGVNVLDIKPGFVDTPMTEEFKKGVLWTKPEQVARGVVIAIDKRKDVVYLPWFWKYIMLGIRLLPEPVFNKLKL